MKGLKKRETEFLRACLFVCVVGMCGCSDDGNGDEKKGNSDTPVVKQCDETQNTCLSQTEVLHCVDGERKREYCSAGEYCFDGKCGAPVCEPGKIERCEANGKYYGCNPLGTGMGTFDCESGFTCTNGQCTPRICKENTGRCLDEETILLCNEAGTAYEVQKKCADIKEKTVCQEGECVSICEQTSKEASYIGCDYWAVDLDNALDAGVYDAAGQPFAVVLSNTHETLTANVEILVREGDKIQQMLKFDVPPQSVRNAFLPDKCYDGGQSCAKASAISGTVLTAEAYHIKSDLPITAAQFNPLDNVQVFSNDASLLFPTTALGKRYMVMARKQTYEQFAAFVTVVAVEPGQTTVTYTTSCDTQSGYDKSGNEIPAMKKGQTQTFVLDQYDVLNIETARFGEDPTGTLVNADKNIAVFAGVEATSIPERKKLSCAKDEGVEMCCITCCADHIEHQQYPLGAWGRNYNAAKLKPRGKERDIWRILSREDGTKVYTTPNVLPEKMMMPDGTVVTLEDGALTLNAGQWIDITTRESFNIRSTTSVLVGQFMAGQDDPMDFSVCRMEQDWSGNVSAGIGDPAYIIGVPVEQYRKNYTFLTPSKYKEDYISVVAPVGTTVTLDGEVLPESDFKPFGDGNYTVAYKLVEDGHHILKASEPVGLFSYGFDHYVSYGYAAGLDLRELF